MNIASPPIRPKESFDELQIPHECSFETESKKSETIKVSFGNSPMFQRRNLIESEFENCEEHQTVIDMGKYVIRGNKRWGANKEVRNNEYFALLGRTGIAKHGESG